MTTLDQLMAGIRQEESSGNYQAQNSIGALGAYQIMSSNLPEWSRQALGYSVTIGQFLSQPSIQDAIARYKLNDYYNRYGAAGAAAMWFSGQPNPNSTASDGSTTVGKYVQNVLNYAGGSSGSSNTTVSNNTASGNQPVTATLDPATLAQQYGFTSAFLNANPELKKIFQQAVSGQWSTDKFKASLMGTTWWKTHSDSERQYLTQTFTDPQTARQSYTQAQVHAEQLMNQMGINVSNKQFQSILGTLTYNIAAKGWNDQQIKYFGSQYVNLLNGRMTGDAETNYSNALQYAYSMGVKMSDSWYQNEIQGIEKGTHSFADLQAGIRNQAKAQFSQFSTQIDAGQTIQDLASPYIQQMGQILEVNPQNLSAFDPTIKSALTYKDPSTGASGSQPLWQFENTLRQDPRWLQTNNARDTMMSTAHGVLQSFGFVS